MTSHHAALLDIYPITIATESSTKTPHWWMSMTLVDTITMNISPVSRVL
jgi:hypothetical protein